MKLALAVTSLSCALLAACVTSSSSGDTLDEPLAFGDDAFATRAACEAAKDRGEYPSLAACQSQILLCPGGGAVTLIGGDVVERPRYVIAGDTLTLVWSKDSRMEATLLADGSLRTSDLRVWRVLDPAAEPGWELGTCSP